MSYFVTSSVSSKLLGDATGSFSGSLTGILWGTSSWSTNSSTSSYISSATLLLTNLSASSITASFTGSLTGMLVGTSSWSTNVITASYANSLNSENGYEVLSLTASSMLVNTGSNTILNAALTVVPIVDSNTSILSIGEVDGYLQINTKNQSSGISASSDIVVTGDVGSETSGYINMGVNSSNYALNYVGTAYDSYLYSISNGNLVIGNVTPGKELILFNGGDSVYDNAKVYIHSNGEVGINYGLTSSVNPPSLTVNAISGDTYNLIYGIGDTNSYMQFNIQNINAGAAGSSDIVATSDNGTENDNYVNLGINSSTYDENSGVVGGPNDAYLYSTGRHFHIGNASTGSNIYIFTNGSDVSSNTRLFISGSGKIGFNTLEPVYDIDLSGSVRIIDSLLATSVTGSLYGTSSHSHTASYVNPNTIGIVSSASYATTSSITITSSFSLTALTASFASGSNITARSSSYSLSSSYALTSSLAFTSSFAATSSYLSGANAVLGNLSASSAVVSGPVTVGGTDGYLKLAMSTQSNFNDSGSYIYLSGSTPDLYFTHKSGDHLNTTKFHWIEGNLYTGLLSGGIITSGSSTTFNISSGSGIIVNLSASLDRGPSPEITEVKWPDLTGLSLTYRTSDIQTFIGIDRIGGVVQFNVPFDGDDFNNYIQIGTVLHQNLSTINGVVTYPSVAYGYKQRTYDFIRAFGPLKISGYNLFTSASAGLTVGSGVAWADGRNYQVDQNSPSRIDDVGTSISKIFRYRSSGSGFVLDTNGGLGYPVVNPTQYNSASVLAAVPVDKWSIQRVFWYPNSATKAIVVYYGNAVYDTSLNAIANLSYESFTEVPNTQKNAIYIGALVLRDDGDFTDPATYSILPGGIFRSIGGTGGGTSVTTTLGGLSDVSIGSVQEADLLIYNSGTGKWINSKVLTNITASVFGSASYSATSSVAVTSSYALSANASLVTGNSYLITSSWATSSFTSSLATTASYSISSSFALTASYASGSNITAQSSSYASTSSFAVTASFASGSNVTARSSSYALTSSFALAANASLVTGDLYFITSSWATTASYALNGASTNARTSRFELGVSSTSAIAVGAKGRKVVGHSGSIVGWRLVTDQSTTTGLDVWKANNAIPTSINTITGSAPISVTAGQLNSSTVLTGWTTDVKAGDVFVLYVNSNNNANYLSLEFDIVLHNPN